MKILRVIVDEMPKSTSRCAFSHTHWNPIMCMEEVNCSLRGSLLNWSLPSRKFVTERCPDCPLALEHDNKKIANEVM